MQKHISDHTWNEKAASTMHITAQNVFREAEALGLADSFQKELIPMATERNFLSKKAAIRNSRIRAGRMKV